jgi:hypothetical protein
VKPLEGLPGATIASTFLHLPTDEQVTLLQSFWDRAKEPEMARSLESILDLPDTHDQQLRDVALRRLYELDPVEGGARILAEIRLPHVDRDMFTVSGKTMGLLPDKTLPQFDDLLARRLGEKESRTVELDAQLIGRYATATILPRIEALYGNATPNTWDCVATSGLMSYFLRVDPDYAIQHLKGPASFCLDDAYSTVVKMGRWLELEPYIIRQLDNPDPWMARWAAEALAKFGGPNAENALWERLRRFHQKWATRENDLQDDLKMTKDEREAIQFQYPLVESLGKAQGWVLNDQQVTELETLTLGTERSNVSKWHWRLPLSLRVDFSFGPEPQSTINDTYVMTGLDSLRVRLGQFPSGTPFRVSAFGSPEKLAPVMQAIRDTAREHGLAVEFEPSGNYNN